MIDSNPVLGATMQSGIDNFEVYIRSLEAKITDREAYLKGVTAEIVARLENATAKIKEGTLPTNVNIGDDEQPEESKDITQEKQNEIVQELIDACNAKDCKRAIATLHKIDFDLRENEVHKKSEFAARTLLMWATIYGQHDLMRECLRTKESDVNEKNEYGSAAIH